MSAVEGLGSPPSAELIARAQRYDDLNAQIVALKDQRAQSLRELRDVCTHPKVFSDGSYPETRICAVCGIEEYGYVMDWLTTDTVVKVNNIYARRFPGDHSVVGTCHGSRWRPKHMVYAEQLDAASGTRCSVECARYASVVLDALVYQMPDRGGAVRDALIDELDALDDAQRMLLTACVITGLPATQVVDPAAVVKAACAEQEAHEERRRGCLGPAGRGFTISMNLEMPNEHEVQGYYLRLLGEICEITEGTHV